ncbi:MAG: HDOD domain-containing protein [Myxococcota bacterium]
MTVPSIDESETLKRALAAAARIATLPQVAARVIELVEDPNSQNAEIEQVIQADPVLSAKILKVANSPMYGFTQKVASVRRAVDLLGHAATRNVTIAVSMAKLFQPGALVPGVDAEALWRHSNATAIASRHVADYFGAPPEEAYLAGLLHEIGIVLEMLVDRGALQQALRLARTDPNVRLCEAERSCFGTDHAKIGAALCREWKLPVAVGQAVAEHHEPTSDAPLAAVVHLANALVPEEPEGFGLDVGADEPTEWMLACLSATPTDLAAVSERVRQAVTG